MDRRKKIERLESRLSEAAAGCRLVYTPETGSTNDLALAAAAAGAPAPSVFLADEQTKGRGRFDRVWASKKGASLTASILVRPECPMECFPMLTEVCGLAVCETLREVCGVDAGIKWPNDVVIGTKKVCGILTLAAPDGQHVVIGAGINLKPDAIPEELKTKAVSLEECAGTATDGDELLIRILQRFFALYEIFLSCGDLHLLRAQYERRLVNIGRTVTLTEGDRTVRGIAEGIDEKGRLLFRTEAGERLSAEAGEVSVKGIYGE